MNIGTHFSPDRQYRYTLWRRWWDENLFVRFVQFIGVNPSTADETINDPTVTRCILYAQKWGYEAMCMTNLFAFRSTDVRAMKRHPAPIGGENDQWLLRVSRAASLVIACWGNHGTHMARDRDVIQFIGTLHCLATSKDGNPKHPLYLKGDLEPKKYSLEGGVLI